jgi:predicted phage terminase large subunit-like protein
MLAQIEGQIIDVNAALLDLDRADCQDSLAAFIRMAWPIVEPSQPYIHGWHIDAICMHLEAITDEVDNYNRLLINIPPGTMKSLAVSVFWPAWEWGPCGMPNMRYVCASYTQELAIRDNMRMRRLVESEWYQTRWPHVKLTRDQNQKTKFENTETGFRQATASGSITGSRGDRVIIDDPHSVESAESEQQRDTTIRWFKEAVPTRLNNPETSAIVVVMQRLHEGDVSGVILDGELGYDHLMLPMRYDPTRAAPTQLGFDDPRTELGELLFPERFPQWVVDREEKIMGPYATAGQFAQLPAPRGGGIIDITWWEPWDEDNYPLFDFIVGSLDTAYTEKQENDFSALTIWGVFGADQTKKFTRISDRGGIVNSYGSEADGAPRVMLCAAWQEKLPIHELSVKVADTCKTFKVDKLLIENKAAGISVAQELRRLYYGEDFSVQLQDPRSMDKLARLYSVQHLFAEGMIFAPNKQWAQMVINQVAVFPKGKHDDLVDTVSQALRHLREMGLLQRSAERIQEMNRAKEFVSQRVQPLY